MKNQEYASLNTSRCGYSSGSEAWNFKVFVYVNGGASAIWDA